MPAPHLLVHPCTNIVQLTQQVCGWDQHKAPELVCLILGVVAHRLRQVALPLVTPAMASLAIFTFLRSWNEFTWPLIVISKNDMMTLPVALARFLSAYRVEYGVVMSAAAFSAIPLIIVFFIFQRQIVQGIALTGLKE